MESNPKITKDKVTVSLGWKLLERCSSQGINLIVQIVLARLLLPSDFGSLAIMVAITDYAAIFVQTGLATAIVQKKDLHPMDVSTLLTASLSVAAVFYVVLYFLSPWIAEQYKLPEIVWPLRVLALILFLNAFNSIQTALLSRSMSFKTIFIRSILAVPISGAVGIAMAYMGFGVWALVAHNLVNMIVVVVVMLFGLDYKLRLGFSWSRAKSLYSFSGKILLSSLVSGFSDTLRTMVIGKKYTVSQLAYYDKAYSYSRYVITIFGQTIQSVMLPVFSRQQDSIETIKRTVRKSGSLTAFVMFPVLLGVCAASKPLILLLLTEKWAASIPYLMIFCVFRLFGCITPIDKQVYLALGKSHIGLFFEIGLLCANLIMLFITVPIGIFAIAIGATIVETLACITIFIISHFVFSYSLKERFHDICRPLLNSVAMAVILWLLTLVIENNIVLLSVQIVTGLMIYYVLAKITKDDNIKEIKELVSNLIHKKFSNYD